MYLLNFYKKILAKIHDSYGHSSLPQSSASPRTPKH